MSAGYPSAASQDRMQRTLFVAIVMFVSTGSALTGQRMHILTGTLGHASTGRAISNASIILDDSVTIFSAADGSFALNAVPAGTHGLVIEADGFVRVMFTITISEAMPDQVDLGFVPIEPLPLIDVTLVGQARDSISNVGVPNAEIMINWEPAGRTASDGTFEANVSLHPGTHVILVRAVGYRPMAYEMNVARSGTINLDVMLPTSPIQLEGLSITETMVVTGPLAGFVRRMSSQMGQFLTPAEIDRFREEVLTTSDVLARVPGITVRPSGRGNVVSFLRCGRPEIFVDGLPVEAEILDDVVDLEHLAAVEVYAQGGRIPPQFNRLQPRRGAANFGACGAIILWTRSGRRE